jgi:hypothetical protein
MESPRTISACRARMIADGLMDDEGRLVFMDTVELANEFRVPELLHQIQLGPPYPLIMPTVLIGGTMPKNQFILAIDSFDTPHGPVLHIEVKGERQTNHTYASSFGGNGFNLIACIADFPVVFIMGCDRYGRMAAADLPLFDPDLPINLYTAALRCAAAAPNRDYRKALQWVKEQVANGNK